jgi:hypothetical protein
MRPCIACVDMHILTNGPAPLQGGEGGNFPLRLRGAKGQYIEFLVRIREQVINAVFGDDRVYSIVGALAQGSGVVLFVPAAVDLLATGSPRLVFSFYPIHDSC